MKPILTISFLVWVAVAGVACGSDPSIPSTPSIPPCTIAKTDLSGVRVTYVEASGIGKVAVRLTAPATARYASGAPLLVNVSTFFTNHMGFYADLAAEEIGGIHVTYVWPGQSDASGPKSEGVYDYGGPKDIEALAEVVRFTTGESRDVDGCLMTELFSFAALPDNVGLYAFSHPGIAAINLMADHGERFPKLRYFVGRENPTATALSGVELGHWAGAPGMGRKENPYGYNYPADYSASGLTAHYIGIGWTATTETACASRGVGFVPSFGNGIGTPYVMGCKIPEMNGKRIYSTEMLQALAAGPLSGMAWPVDLATVAEAQAVWPYRSVSPAKYQQIVAKLPDLKVMLVDAVFDHVLVLDDKPHIHTAWDNFRAGNLWVRFNPDRAYVEWVTGAAASAFPDNAANLAALSEASSWTNAATFSFPNNPGTSVLVPLAATAEMMDRVQVNNWETNLTAVLSSAPKPTLE